MEKITSRTNEKIKFYTRLSASAKERNENSLFTIEGARLCFDAFLSGEDIKVLYFTEKANEKFSDKINKLCESADECYIITDDIAHKLSDTASPQGIFCIVKQRQNSLAINKKDCYIALDSMQDPANLGATARTAEALGIKGIILYNCCDIYNPKALRASMGAFFRLPVMFTDNLLEVLENAEKNGLLTVASVPDSNAESITSLSFEGGAVTVIGNEGNGVSGEIIEKCTVKATIEMKGRAESLNAAAAAAIIMWEMMK